MTIKIAETIDLNIQYITNKDGEKIAVILPIKEFKELLNIRNKEIEKYRNIDRQITDENEIWKIAQKITEDMTEEELEKLPRDGAQQHDHYIYGSPKK